MRMVLRKLWLPIAPKVLMISPTLLLNYLLLKPMRFGWKMQLNLWNITLNASSSSPNSHTSNSSGISPSSLLSSSFVLLPAFSFPFIQSFLYFPYFPFSFLPYYPLLVLLLLPSSSDTPALPPHTQLTFHYFLS